MRRTCGGHAEIKSASATKDSARQPWRKLSPHASLRRYRSESARHGKLPQWRDSPPDSAGVRVRFAKPVRPTSECEREHHRNSSIQG